MWCTINPSFCAIFEDFKLFQRFDYILSDLINVIIYWQSATYMHASSGNQCQIRLDSTKKLSNIREILFNCPKIPLKKLSRILLLIYINRILSLLSQINTLSLVLVFFFFFLTLSGYQQKMPVFHLLTNLNISSPRLHPRYYTLWVKSQFSTS